MSGLSLHTIGYPARHGDPERVSPKIVHLIAAARPNFMKVAPLYHELAGQSWCTARIVHTGQHYDANMSDSFFRDLRLPEPAHHLEVGSGTHAEQTGRTMIAYEGVCQRERRQPSWWWAMSMPPRPARSWGRSCGSPSCISRRCARKPSARSRISEGTNRLLKPAELAVAAREARAGRAGGARRDRGCTSLDPRRDVAGNPGASRR